MDHWRAGALVCKERQGLEVGGRGSVTLSEVVCGECWLINYITGGRMEV